MPDQNQTNINDTAAPIIDTSSVVSDDVAVADSSAVAEDNSPQEVADEARQQNIEIMTEVASKIAEYHSILIALSSDPSVDELSAAIGLSLCLDRAGKRATAIYSGATPNALEFLKPGTTFEDSAECLQDFVIALNKDKADHLRYKLDGDFVRIYITPYKTRIKEEDLDYAYGDYNVDLVLALNVANGVDLDAALREHGRIMHDAMVINITTGNPGKFGEIEWSNKHASSVCEMVAELLFGLKKNLTIEAEEATAFLTGIVSATEKFSNASTTADTMRIASMLMEAGADQLLITENLTDEIDNKMFSFNNDFSARPKYDDVSSMEVEHEEDKFVVPAREDENEEKNKETESKEETVVQPEISPVLPEVEATQPEAANDQPEESATQPKNNVVLPEVETAQPEVTAAQPEVSTVQPEENVASPEELVASSESLSEPGGDVSLTPSTDFMNSVAKENVVEPSSDFKAGEPSEGSTDYGQMLEEALKEGDNPAMAAAPEVASSPEINGVPVINYDAAEPGGDILPPPPVPPVDINASMPTDMGVPVMDNNVAQPVVPSLEPETKLAEATDSPVVVHSEEFYKDKDGTNNDAPVNPLAPAGDSFKIPGM